MMGIRENIGLAEKEAGKNHKAAGHFGGRQQQSDW